MLNIICRTNLDLHRYEIWPTELPCRPITGDLIVSNYIHKWHVKKQERCEIRLELEVVRVRFQDGNIYVELHLPKGRYESISDFYKNFYQPLIGQLFI